jgi:stage V sporulation protein D (sporulation-specific penicillin-binding protein)
MEDPEYIVLAALDTPSRETGIYISGGVMAAPTVGAVMADILPYLGVQRKEETEILVEDYTDLTQADAARKLKESGIMGKFSGNGETVTAQLPAAGQTVPSGSEILLYLGQEPEESEVEVPDFSGLHRQQAAEAALALILEQNA